MLYPVSSVTYFGSRIAVRFKSSALRTVGIPQQGGYLKDFLALRMVDADTNSLLASEEYEHAQSNSNSFEPFVIASPCQAVLLC